MAITLYFYPQIFPKSRIFETTCNNNAKKQYLHGDVRRNKSSLGTDEDWYFPCLHKVIEKNNIELSRLIWQTMRDDSADKLEAHFSWNASSELRKAPSLLVNWLTSKKWIPQGDETFVHPSKASMNLLPEGFPFDPGWPWLKAIHFGEDTVRKHEENRQRQAAAKEMGFSDEKALKTGLWLVTNLSPEQIQEFQVDFERRNAELPEHEPANPTRRAKRVGKLAAEAPERRTEERMRAVSVGREAVKEEAGQYLRQQYTNSDGEMICQVCKEPLPFKLDDGSYFFETVEFQADLKNRHFQNYLALCPNHSAMFRHANGSRELMTAMFDDLEGNELEVVLAQQDGSIYFTKTHIADLKAAMETEALELRSNDDQAVASDDGSGE